MTGAAVQWLRDGLQIIGSAAETAAIAATVDDSEGVVFVPALTGLGAPHWDPHARGLLIGLTRGTTRAHIVRATLEAIAFEVRDVLETMPGSAGSTLRVDGGASANDLLCQIQADQIGVPVERPEIVETTALGAAFLAGLGTGVWSSTDDLRHTWQLDRRFEPTRLPRGRRRRPRPLDRGRRPAPRAGPTDSPDESPVQPDLDVRPDYRSLASAAAAASRSLVAAATVDSASARTSSASASSSSTSSNARLELGDLAPELVELGLELHAAGLEVGDVLARRRPAPRTPRPAGPRPPRAPARPRRGPSGPPPGRVRRAARAAPGLPRRRGGWPRIRAPPGVATAPATSASSTPVLARAVTSRPLRTARAHSSSTMAAVRVASTWSATAWVTFTPSPAATDRARVVTAAVSCRRCRVSARSSSPYSPAWASRSASPTASTCSTCSVSRRTSRLTTQAATDGFCSALTWRGQVAALELLGLRVAGRREVTRGAARRARRRSHVSSSSSSRRRAPARWRSG